MHLANIFFLSNDFSEKLTFLRINKTTNFMPDFNKKWTLEEKNALITGGTKGIGRAIAEEFLNLGANVLICSRNDDKLKATVEEMQHSGNIDGIECDVSDMDDISRLIDFVRGKWDKLDVLVNNAGTNIRKISKDYSPEEYDFLMNTNLRSAFEISRQCLPAMKNSGDASIINIGSVAGLQIVRTGAPYAASKAGMRQMTRYFAVEWAEFGIRANSIEPWYIRTPLTEPVLKNEEKYEYILSRTPLNRTGEPSEIATLAAFLAMPASSYLTGQNIAADGGATCLLL